MKDNSTDKSRAQHRNIQMNKSPLPIALTFPSVVPISPITIVAVIMIKHLVWCQGGTLLCNYVASSFSTLYRRCREAWTAHGYSASFKQKNSFEQNWGSLELIIVHIRPLSWLIVEIQAGGMLSQSGLSGIQHLVPKWSCSWLTKFLQTCKIYTCLSLPDSSTAARGQGRARPKQCARKCKCCK